MFDSHLPSFGQPKKCQPIDEVLLEFKKITDICEAELRGVSVVEWGHMQKYLVEEVRNFSKQESMISKIEKYI